jgi:cell division protein FtsW (lipid II flippase)
MLNLIMLFTSLVLVIAAAVTPKRVPAVAGALPVLPLDRGVAVRVRVAAVLLSFLLVAGLIAVYSANPDRFRWAVERPIDRLLEHYHWVAFAGVGLYAIVRLCGVKHRHSLWLLCLSLPGALTMPVTFVAALAAGADRWDEVTFELLIHPATWILTIIVIRQWVLLRKPGDIHLLSALAQTLLIVAVYLFSVRFPWP